MGKTKFYAQCELKRRNEDRAGFDAFTYTVMISWIPSEYAKVGNWLKLKNKNGEWENHWQVTRSWSKKEASYVEANERNYLHQRKVSDI